MYHKLYHIIYKNIVPINPSGKVTKMIQIRMDSLILY